jgi:membrane protease subunit (stomatin/prohibitin family)
MGILDFVKKQFIDILQWTEMADDVLVWRFPVADFEIQQGGRLVVRDTQMALFVDQGRAADLFGPGTHTLHTRNLPVLTDLRHWDKRFESPFKSDVYFFSTRLRLNQTWGTATPLTIRDREFGAVRVRGYGLYAYRIADPRVFFTKVSGTRDVYLVGDLEGQLRSTVVSAFSDHLGESQVPFLDMAANQDELARAVLDRARAPFAELGLAIEALQIQSLSLPDELVTRLDERIGMGVVGDLDRYTRFQTGQSIPTAAAAPGGAAGAGVGLGAGIAMGQAMNQAIGQPGPRPAGPSEPPPAAADRASASAGSAVFCGNCEVPLDRVSRFCPECGARLE